jgi:choline kinase
MFERYPVTLFENPRWEATNMVSSLLCAKAWLEQTPCIVSYADIFYSVNAVRSLAAADTDIAITYDVNWQHLWVRRFGDPLIDAETFRLAPDGFLLDIGHRPHSLADVEGQYMGLLSFTPSGWKDLSKVLMTFPRKRVERMSMTEMLQELLARGLRIRAVPIEDEWGEIDSPSDLKLYCS